jgi:hypothetical protein
MPVTVSAKYQEDTNLKRLGNHWGMALTLMLGICAMFATTAAHAQIDTDATPELSKDWTIRLGMYVFNSTTARNAAGSVGFSGIVERRVYAGNNYEINIGTGYNGFNSVYNVPFLIDIVATSANLRWGGGAGYSFGKRVDGRGTSGATLEVLLGYQLTHTTNPLSLDLRYDFVSGSNDELDGYSLTLGYRF